MTEKKAHVAELVDAADSKSAIRKDVKVRFLSWALPQPCIEVLITDLQGFFIFRPSAFSRLLRGIYSELLGDTWLTFSIIVELFLSPANLQALILRCRQHHRTAFYFFPSLFNTSKGIGTGSPEACMDGVK